MDALSFKLDVFEGPLDLLLRLISKNKINIFDIPISSLLDQYMAAVDEMKTVDMDIAGEFISMASYLLYIKSKMLLPQHEEEEEDPRELLVRMLLEYQRYKDVAQKMTELYSGSPLRASRNQMELELPEEPYSRTHTVDELGTAYNALIKITKHRLPPPVSSFKGIVGTTWTTISTRVINILRRLMKNRKMTVSEVYCNSKSRSDVVASFLAILELMHSKRIIVDAAGENIEINDRKVSENENTGN